MDRLDRLALSQIAKEVDMQHDNSQKLYINILDFINVQMPEKEEQKTAALILNHLSIQLRTLQENRSNIKEWIIALQERQ